MVFSISLLILGLRVGCFLCVINIFLAFVDSDDYICKHKKKESNLRQILIVEDEAIVAMDIRYRLVSMGYSQISIVPDYNRAIDVLQKCRPDLIVIDIGLKGEKTGLDLAALINDEYRIPFFIISGQFDQKTIDCCKAISPVAYLPKPFNYKDLSLALNKSFKRIIANELLDKISTQFSDNVSCNNNGVVVFDSKASLLGTAGCFSEITGIPKEKSNGMNLWDLVSTENILEIKLHLQELFKEGEVRFIVQIRSPKDKLVTVLLDAYTIRSKEMHLPFFIIFFKESNYSEYMNSPKNYASNTWQKDALSAMGQHYVIKALEIAK